MMIRIFDVVDSFLNMFTENMIVLLTCQLLDCA